MVLNIILDSYNTALILATELYNIQQKEKNSSTKSDTIFNLMLIVIKLLVIKVRVMAIWDRQFFLSLYDLEFRH